MIILLSPAKTLDLDSPYAERPTEARFAAEANRIARAAAKLGPERLAELMHISPKLAALNAARFKNFAQAEERPAIRAFAGDVYRGFDASSLNEDAIGFAQEHLRILSGLYGVLRPLDAIRPYRLEMGTKWAPKADKLTDHWGTKVMKAVLSDLKQEGSGTILNLASNEYYAAVRPHLPRRGVRVIAADFRVRTAKGMQFQSFTAKVARGTLARWVCEERITDPAALRFFDADGWRFEAEGSTPNKPLYVRG
ncbi:YaaA family protein [uncultured Sphingomonas sp.]|uniref:YaaA family protein n=1 Tax=uncultured Sphingomonas sp. TaxID=158754 RepID=UPI0025E6869B|nr:YaaA family protein [uncultured Sphingomonas sp.]